MSVHPFRNLNVRPQTADCGICIFLRYVQASAAVVP